jgi:putative iron-regulated protein
VNNRLKVWTGIGTYALVNVGFVNLGAIAVPAPNLDGNEPLAVVAEISLEEEVGTWVSQSPATGGQCRAFAVNGGGEGGEGGEGGISASSPSITVEVPPSPETAEALPFGDRQILVSFVDQVMIPTYEQLAEQSSQLVAAVNAFAAEPNESSLQTAREAWLEARSPWEQSEAFAFGPADSLGYDANLDDWPINQVDVRAVLDSQDALSEDYIDTLQTNQKGFHTIEFLLFGAANDKALSDFSPRELQYLQLVTTAFDQTANELLTSWTTGVDGNPPYRDEFVNAGEGSNAYPTLQAAAAEIVQGIVSLLDELANAKIDEPLQTQNPFLLESRFSSSSLRDFEFNLQSVQNTYLGQASNTTASGKGLNEFVASVNPELDRQIQQSLQAAFSAIEAIPEPIENTICDSGTEPSITTARDSVLTLLALFEQHVLPLVQE